ncbi:rac GTPase-activating protein 1-like isoform X2 [Acanthaster planci]|uniref:Rac GTPase-activating protein 1-like isoform X2 n=1 Tax=Acanthaster planci TaxID=133434 RepID=A0A8B7Y0P4_ACAPL|nr:rac GTPase-activating protein 1-like isoform X2 [Acanthaster planci]
MSGGSSMSIVAAFDEICHYQSVLSKGCEPEFLKFAKNQDSCRRQWLSASQEKLRMQEFITKITAEKDGLDVKLKHARNQVDVEMKRRTRAEARSDELDQQIMLIRELLADNKMNQLSEKDRESLAFLRSEQQNGGGTPTATNRLSAIHEHSADLLSPSDVSYDHTEEDLDVSYLRGGKTWKRGGGRSASKKRPSAPPLEEDTPPKKVKTQYITYSPSNDKETSIVKTTVTVPADGPITAAMNIETVPRLDKSFSRPPGPKNRKRPSRELLKSGEHNVPDDSFWSLPENQHLKAALNSANVVQHREEPIKTSKAARQHSFCTKTVLKPESCKPCGKRIKFGKYALKCKDCRMVCHPDCQDEAPLPCQPVVLTPTKSRPYGPNTQLSDVAPSTSPMVPPLVVQCVAEVERRGMSEEGLYRLSGSERAIKELKERAMLGKDLHLDRTPDINNVTGLLKDFLRNLSEPLVTYKLHPTFMRAAALPDPDDCATFTYQAISELPLPNRDTLAYIILHLQRVAESPACKMGVVNLSRVFGPTIVGHAVPDPEPLQMLNDTKQQPAVVDRLLSLPTDFWKAFVNVDAENAVTGDMNVITNRHFGTPEAHPTVGHIGMPGSLRTPASMNKKDSFKKSGGSNRFGPVNTPQTQGKMGKKTPSSSSISKARSIFTKTPLTPRFGSKSENTVKKSTHFFASPTLR